MGKIKLEQIGTCQICGNPIFEDTLIPQFDDIEVCSQECLDKRIIQINNEYFDDFDDFENLWKAFVDKHWKK